MTQRSYGGASHLCVCGRACASVHAGVYITRMSYITAKQIILWTNSILLERIPPNNVIIKNSNNSPYKQTKMYTRKNNII